MLCKDKYQSPLGEITIVADEQGITGIGFAGQKYYALNVGQDCSEGQTPAIAEAKRWLDVYFSGKRPSFCPPLHITGTAFQLEVWEILRTIPYGSTTTYGRIAEIIAQRRGVKKMSAQAVGGAVGHNKISVIIPCHRVVGSNGSLTGYAGGIDRKLQLLKLENAISDGNILI